MSAKELFSAKVGPELSVPPDNCLNPESFFVT